jgi:2-dehydro-3-deoxyphosphogluconate aldolase / (4S)-4-hydroxy-2-oxoglutarate aldolase
MNIRDVMKMAPVIPVLTVTKLAHAAPLARALANGGLMVLEVTLRTPIALQVIAAMRAAVPEAIVGVGTITKPEQFAEAEQAGSQFGVTPGLTAALAAAAGSVKYPLLPGIMTPSELVAARALGFSACKLFPAQQAGGVGMLKALGAVFGDVVFCPTGGVSRQNASEFLALPNVLCVGGSWVAPADLMEKGDWAGIEALAKDAATLRR